MIEDNAKKLLSQNYWCFGGSK